MKYFKLTLVNESQTEERYISLEVTEIRTSEILNTAVKLGKLYPPMATWVKKITEISKKEFIKKGLVVDVLI